MDRSVVVEKQAKDSEGKSRVRLQKKERKKIKAGLFIRDYVSNVQQTIIQI